jgi:hypothetical protein
MMMMKALFVQLGVCMSALENLVLGESIVSQYNVMTVKYMRAVVRT